MTLKTLLQPIAQDMLCVNDLIKSRLASEVALINQIGDYIIAAGGKRMRPALVLLSARAHGCTDESPYLLAAIVEFIHTATLLHDDVVDESDKRRGRNTANAVWGNAGAVLSGDFLYSRSFQLMVEADRMDVMHLLADTTNAIAEGEVLQLMNAGDPDVSEERYMRVIELKTARLFQAATQLGAMAANADAATVKRANEFGYALGMAFQIVDDLLDYTASEEEMGKNLGDDLAEGKPTLPLIYAMKHGTDAQKLLIKNAVTHAQVDKLKEVVAAVESCGAINYTAKIAAQYIEKALSALHSLPESEWKTSLEEITRFTTSRGN